MNKMTQTALAALVFGLGSAAYAGGGGHGGGGYGGHHSGKHGCGSDCKGDIKIDLVVDKHCDLDIDDKYLKLDSKNRFRDSTHFDVRTNANYSLKIEKPTQLVNGGKTVPVDVVTTGKNYKEYTSGTTVNWDGSKHTYKVTATSRGWDPLTTMAGTYSGTYKVEVKF